MTLEGVRTVSLALTSVAMKIVVLRPDAALGQGLVCESCHEQGAACQGGCFAYERAKAVHSSLRETSLAFKCGMANWYARGVTARLRIPAIHFRLRPIRCELAADICCFHIGRIRYLRPKCRASPGNGRRVSAVKKGESCTCPCSISKMPIEFSAWIFLLGEEAQMVRASTVLLPRSLRCGDQMARITWK